MDTDKLDIIAAARPVFDLIASAEGDASIVRRQPTADTRAALEMIERYMEEHEPDQQVVYQGTHFLDKWIIREEEDGVGFVYLHRIFQGDDTPTLHDHSRHVASWVLAGGGAEMYQVDDSTAVEIRPIAVGDLIYRNGDRFKHRLHEVDPPFISLYCGGEKLRETFRTFLDDGQREVPSREYWQADSFQANLNL